MGPVSKAVLYGCTLALQWTLWLVGALLFLLIAVQYFRGDAGANPVANLVLAAAFCIAGCVALYAKRAIEKL